MKYLKRGQWIIFLIWALFNAEKSCSQIILEAPNSANESNYKWFNEADSNFKILSTDYYLEVSEPGVYYATYDEISIRNNATGYFVLTFCDEINSQVTLDLSLAGCEDGEIRWNPLSLGNDLSPIVVATNSAIMYSATWTRKSSVRKFPEITVMCIPDNKVFVGKDKPLIYNVITPNEDGYNDYFKIKNIEYYPQNQLEITDRSGYLVYKAKGYNNSSIVFKGKSNVRSTLNKKALLEKGTYLYKLQYKNEQTNQSITISGFLYIKKI